DGHDGEWPGLCLNHLMFPLDWTSRDAGSNRRFGRIYRMYAAIAHRTQSPRYIKQRDMAQDRHTAVYRRRCRVAPQTLLAVDVTRRWAAEYSICGGWKYTDTDKERRYVSANPRIVSSMPSTTNTTMTEPAAAPAPRI